jgi:6-phosphogluconate dehydrogenase
MQPVSDIGLVGLAVMGENLVLNMESKGFHVSVFNRTVEKVDKFINGRGAGKNIYGAHSLEELVASLKTPRRVFLMVKALNKMQSLVAKPEEPVEEEPAPVCPHCLEEVKPGATKCPHCGSDIK